MTPKFSEVYWGLSLRSLKYSETLVQESDIFKTGYPLSPNSASKFPFQHLSLVFSYQRKLIHLFIHSSILFLLRCVSWPALCQALVGTRRNRGEEDVVSVFKETTVH